MKRLQALLTILAVALIAVVSCEPRDLGEDNAPKATASFALQSPAGDCMVGTIEVRDLDGDIVYQIDTDCTKTSQSESFVPGTYTVGLADGYICIPAGDPADYIGCEFIAADPNPFTVELGVTTNVSFSFNFLFESGEQYTLIGIGAVDFSLDDPVDREVCGPDMVECESDQICATLDVAVDPDTFACYTPCTTDDDTMLNAGDCVGQGEVCVPVSGVDGEDLVNAGLPNELNGVPHVCTLLPSGAGGAGGASATGGTTSTGGVATGGAPTGGVLSTGGAPTGGAPTGGIAPTGGATPTGGVPTGGIAPTGGAPTGGAPTGGIAPTGGTTPTGGVGGSGGDMVLVTLIHEMPEGLLFGPGDAEYTGSNGVFVWSYWNAGGVEHDGTICAAEDDLDPDPMRFECQVSLPRTAPFWLFDVFMPFAPSPDGFLTWGNWGNRPCEPWGGGDGDPVTGEPNGDLFVYVDGVLVGWTANHNPTFNDPDPGTACEAGEQLNNNAWVTPP